MFLSAAKIVVFGLLFLGALDAFPIRHLLWPRGAEIYRDQEYRRTTEVFPSTANCSEEFITQPIDHYRWGAIPGSTTGTFNQRYYVYDKLYKHGGPIFFYFGNEADVGLYVNHTGLMWESAAEFNALLLFSEHRYWGESCLFPEHPCGDDQKAPNPNAVHHEYLTYEQALEDHAHLIQAFKRKRGINAPVIAFGGSYGGMLAYWARVKYPHVVTGAIAASAPIRIFDGWEPKHAFKSETYWQVHTRDADASGGALPGCSVHIRQAFDALMSLGNSTDGRQQLAETFRVCGGHEALTTTDDVRRLYKLQLFTFDSLGMGNYPYPSNYITGTSKYGNLLLPAFPMREACIRMEAQLSSRSRSDHKAAQLLRGLFAATAVVTNASKMERCIPLPSDDADDGQDCVLCDYFTCTNGNPLETEFVRDGVHDMFLPENFDPTSTVLGGVNVSAIEERCERLYSTKPRWRRMADDYGTERAVTGTSNVFFSNGDLDPWSSGGVTWVNSSATDSVSFMIHNGAHHLDLMFSHPDDPPSVREARALEREFMHRWVASWRRAQEQEIYA